MEQLPHDPYMLLSLVNMKLRDQYNDLDDLCKSLGVDKKELCDCLHDAGFDYDPVNNRFA
ncbi:MAG: DUF4250 domain-containing protein [Muribaculaceae bacterium]|nr:DUF4250 domain-containing protein [Muribaculaceae bacterium]